MTSDECTNWVQDTAMNTIDEYQERLKLNFTFLKSYFFEYQYFYILSLPFYIFRFLYDIIVSHS